MEATAIALGVVALVALAAWVGEVVTLNFIIVPGINALDEAGRAAFIGRYLPRFFRMATVLALTTVLSGLGVGLIAAYGPDIPHAVPVGGSAEVLIAAILIVALACFHLVAQSRLRPIVESFAVTPDPEKVGFVTRFLGIVPRIGLVVIVGAFVLLMIELLTG